MSSGKANTDTNLYLPDVELSKKKNNFFAESVYIKKHLLFCLVKEKEDAHTDPEFQPMKDDDCTFVEYR